MLQIVLPMAGRGQRFVQAGYRLPKPLLPVRGEPMAALVVRNVRPQRPHRFIFLCLREHLRDHGLGGILAAVAPEGVVVPVDGVTEGAACTVLLARDHFDPDQPLMTANCDQWVDTSIDDYLARADAEAADGYLMTMTDRDPNWSFAALDDRGLVTRVEEKRPISDQATVGIYNFARARHFLDGADAMIAQDLRVNGEFYVAPVYNRMIAAGLTVRTCNVGPVSTVMHGLGVPEDYEAFLRRGAAPG